MKTQMRFQNLIFKISLIISALAIVYALAFCTGAIAYIGHWYKGSSSLYGNYAYDRSALLDTYDDAQTYTNVLLALGIVFILLVVVCYIFANSKRRNYYKVNYITTFILAGYAIVWAVLAIIFSLNTQIGILGNDAWMLGAKEYYETHPEDSTLYTFSSSTWIYIVGYIISVVAIVDALALIYNCIWKMKLMKGEKELLANGLNVSEVKEVA